MISIIDYGSGNPGSVKNMIDYLKVDSIITDDIDKISSSDAIILPGVGSFGDCIESLDKLKLKEPLIGILNSIKFKSNYNNKSFKKIIDLRNIKNKDRIDEKIKKNLINKKFLGICVGMQILFERSEESPNIKGLGIFRGDVVKFKKGKIPQIGWNDIDFSDKIKNDYFYFVNSYYAKPVDKSIILGESDNIGKFTSAIKQGDITAVQFHAEKSGEAGINFFRWWLSC